MTPKYQEDVFIVNKRKKTLYTEASVLGDFNGLLTPNIVVVFEGKTEEKFTIFKIVEAEEIRAWVYKSEDGSTLNVIEG